MTVLEKVSVKYYLIDIHYEKKFTKLMSFGINSLRPEGAENIILGSQVSDLCF